MLASPQPAGASRSPRSRGPGAVSRGAAASGRAASGAGGGAASGGGASTAGGLESTTPWAQPNQDSTSSRGAERRRIVLVIIVGAFLRVAGGTGSAQGSRLAPA